MKISSEYYHRRISARVACLFVVLAAAFVGLTHSTMAASEKPVERGQYIVTIYDQGEKRVVLTRAHTVKDTLQQAGISLSNSDKVEPALDTQYVTQQYTVNIYRAHPVTIIDGMKREQVLTPYSAPRDIAKHAGLETQDEDELMMTQSEDMLVDGVGSKLVIDRATPLTLVLYGKRTTVYTQRETVAELLNDKKITLEKDDTLSVAPENLIQPGMTIEIWRNGVQTVNEEQEVDYPVEQIQDADREIGYREVKTLGVKGKKTVTFEVTMKNGQEVERKEIQSVVTTEPQKQVEVVGAKSAFGGDFAAALAKLRACEAGGNYANKKNPSYRGAYQFGYGTWGNYGGYYDPADAPPAVQDQAARDLYVRRGWQPWPHCGSGLPDTYR
jgi:resuscitation-promoting factor RpfB